MTEPETMTAYEKRCISRAAAYIAQAVCQLRMADTPQAREMADELMPLVAKVEKVG